MTVGITDTYTADFPHGTPAGYQQGCRGLGCPTADIGLSCKTAARLARGDYQYQKLARQNRTPAEIADALGLNPSASTAPTPTTEETTMPAHTPSEQSPKLAAKIAITPEASATIRAWARDHGHVVPGRGPLPHRIIDAYLQAQAGEPTAPPALNPAEPPAGSAALLEAMLQREAQASAALDGETFTVDGAPNDYTDMLDEARDRADDVDRFGTPVSEQNAAPPSSSDERADWSDFAVAPQQPATDEHVEWAEVAISVDVEQARNIAVRLEQENAHLIAERDDIAAERDRALAGLTFVLGKLAAERDAYTDLAGVAERQHDELASNRHAFASIHDAALSDQNTIAMMRHQIAVLQDVVADQRSQLVRNAKPSAWKRITGSLR